jgi:hypothetical protein
LFALNPQALERARARPSSGTKPTRSTRKPDPLAFLNESTVGTNEAVNRILKDPDLIVAASRAFPDANSSIPCTAFVSKTISPLNTDGHGANINSSATKNVRPEYWTYAGHQWRTVS